MVAISALAFFSLAMTILSVWVKRSPWIWGAFLILAFALGFLAKLIEPIALAPIGAVLILQTLLKGDIRGLARFVLVAITVAISIGLQLRFFPGFNVWIQNLSFSKPFMGIFVLALGFPLVKNLQEFGNVMKVAIPLALMGIFIMLSLGLSSHLIGWDPKFPSNFWFFIIKNLIFVSIIEEAFWRGFVQNEFFRWFGGRSFLANVGAVVVTSIFFAILHYPWAPNIPFLILVFVASLIYGSIYQLTRSLEASILCHWTFNVIHFALFSYPFLAPLDKSF